ncbi:MAG: M24 family metallopeptidase [Anaerolineae bacterium]
MSGCSLSYTFPNVLPMRQRAAVVNECLRRRLDVVLPEAMRRAGIDLWLMVCNEDNLDPVFRTMVPAQAWTPILQIAVFHDRGDGTVERLNLSRTNMYGLMDGGWDPATEDQWQCLRRVVAERDPRRIGIDQSDVIWAADGLTAGLKERLLATLGDDLAARVVSAEAAAVYWLETHVAEELDLYEQAGAIAHAVIAECFSRRAITPGVTTCEDLRWYYWQRTTDLGLPVSFTPYFRFFRSPEARARWGEGDTAIRPGDLLHCDVGFEYLRLITDHQEMAYVLRPGESDAPAGLRAAMAQANRLQDVFLSAWQQGLTGNAILARVLVQARAEGLSRPKIYSHSLGHYLHEPGPLMGLPWQQGDIPGRGDVTMEYGSCFTVELSVTGPLPEWGGEEVPVMLEQDAAFVAGGPYFIDGRQTTFHLI